MLSNPLGTSKPPHIQLAGLRIWVHGRQFPDANDYDDANWLHVTAQCSAEGAMVEVSGYFIHLSEIAGWVYQCEELKTKLAGAANLECMEPELSVYLSAESLGHVAMQVKITPDHMTQKHVFDFEIDQTYMNKLIQECRMLLAQYPLKHVEHVQ